MASKLSTLPHPAMLSFIEHLDIERNLSKLTIKNYSRYLRTFVDWYVSQNYSDLKEFDMNVLRDYRLYLSNQTYQGEEISKKTQSYYLIALRSMLKWMVKNDMEVMNPEKIELPKTESEHMKFLSSDYIERILTKPDVSTLKGLRDRAMLELLYSTGLRVSELVSVDRDKLDLSRKEFGVIGKGRKPRVVFLSDRASMWLGRWIDSREDRWNPVFIRLSRKKADPMSDGESMRITTRSVQRIVDKYVRQAKVPVKLTPHGIRHSFATDLLSNGASLRDVQEMLGHKSVATTQIYTHVTHPKLRKTHEKYHSKI